MLDHITISVRDYEKSKAFYTEALKPLGYSLLLEVAGFAGFGDSAGFVGFGSEENNGPIATFWMYQGEGDMSARTHIAFRAKSAQEVDHFYTQALAAGGKDNGAPGIRAHYHPNYYGAFVHDPDGNNIEAVCHEKK